MLVVRNKRGWEIEVEKEWSDKDFTSDHDAIYTAAYVGDDLIPGTVKKMKYPTTSLRYFFDDLDSIKKDSTFSDYSIKEVIVTNPVMASTDEDEVDVVSYDSLTLVNPDDFIQINSKLKEKTTSEPFWYNVNYEQGEPVGGDIVAGGYTREDTIENTRGGGIVISLYKWGSQGSSTKTPLPEGEFTLTENGVEVGTFTSNKRGRITILYEFKYNIPYVLTEIKTPEGYIGLPYPVTFHVNDSNEIIWNDAEEGDWVYCYKSQHTSPDNKEIVAYVDTFNKPVEFKVLKIDKDNQTWGLPGAHFALYKSVNSGLGGEVKDYNPMPGYTDLVSDASGVIPKVDNTLKPGKYYLNETHQPVMSVIPVRI